MNCTLCNTVLKKKADEKYFICPTCGAYVKDKKYYVSPEREKIRYEEHNNDVTDIRYQNFTSPITNFVLENFEASQLGLDYGSGTGPVITKMLTDKGYKVKLYDPYFHPDSDYLNYKYDYILSCEVFEHFYYPKKEIEKILSLLKTNGKLLIMTEVYDNLKDFKTWSYPKDITHVFIYTEKTINYIAEKFNLDIEKQNHRLIVFRKR